MIIARMRILARRIEIDIQTIYEGCQWHNWGRVQYRAFRVLKMVKEGLYGE